MTDFDYDVYLKKRIARGYRNKKNGSKSKRCSLGSDNMTQKQWKERNGEVMSYNLSSPMSWDEFKMMPQDLRAAYITRLKEKYSVTATDLARFFGCVPSTITKYCKSELGITFNPGKRMTKEQKVAFREFTGEVETEEVPQDTEEESQVSFDTKSSEPVFVPESEGNGFNMREITMSFCGGFDPDALRNSLALTIGKGRAVRIDINCTIIG